jgi:hypothetical protein
MTTTWVWRKSSRSATNGACVEIGTSPDTALFAIRDSKSGSTGPVLTVTAAGLGTLLHDVTRQA